MLVMCHISTCSADLRMTLQLSCRTPGDCVHVCMNMLFDSIDDMYMSFTIQKDIYILLNTIDDMYMSYTFHIYMLLYDIYSSCNELTKKWDYAREEFKIWLGLQCVPMNTSFNSIDDINMSITV